MSRCPFCEYVTPEPDDGDASVRSWQEVAHMQEAHPDVIHARLREAGIDADVEIREDKLEAKERELKDLEERLKAKEAELTTYVAQVQGALKRREDEWWKKVTGDAVEAEAD